MQKMTYTNTLTSRSLTALMFVSILAGCPSSKHVELETFYLKINEVRIAVPAQFVNAGSGLADNPKTYEQVSRLASASPGLPIDTLFFIADANTLQPVTEAQANQMKSPADVLYIWLRTIRPPIPLAETSSTSNEWTTSRRSPSDDQYGLEAFRVESSTDLNYRAKIDDKKSYRLECRGGGLPNPTCRAKVRWHGQLLEYTFNQTHLSAWKSLNDRLTSLIDSFVY